MNTRACPWRLATLALPEVLAGAGVFAGTIGPDPAWPRSSPAVDDSAATLGPATLAAWLADHARDEHDELVYVRVAAGFVVDVALGVAGGWAPRLAGHRRGWHLVASTVELLADRPSPAALAARIADAIEAALGRVGT